MRSRVLFGFILLTSTVLLLFSQEQEPLGDAARRLRSEKTSSQQPVETKRVVAKLSAYTPPNGPYLVAEAAASGNPVDSTDDARYEEAVRSLLLADNFDELDRTAARDRSTKSRFPGGGWKLYIFYRAISGRNVDATPEPEVVADIEHLKRWVAAKPESITARVGLAGAYYTYAWVARGMGYANVVDDKSWGPYQERLRLCRTTLEEAANLKEKDPHWYWIMLRLLRSVGADLSQITAIMEKASSIEPLYYYYYNEYAFALQPRWYGEVGDSEKFADAVAAKIGGAEGAIDYFRLAYNLNCVGCAESKDAFSRMSWPRIQEGYAALEQRYGLSKLWLNAFARLAVLAEDHLAANQAFLRIGSNWDQSVWIDRSYFDSSKNWALAPPVEFVDLWNNAEKSVQVQGGLQYVQKAQADFNQKNAQALQECRQLIKEDTERFDVLMKLNQNGDVQETTAWPPTKLSGCVVPKLARHAVAPPPNSPFWMILSFIQKPAERPTIHGPALPEAMATVPMPPQIEGDLNADTSTDPEAMAKYAAAARDLLYKNKFDELEKIAANDRDRKTKFSGGAWKLYVLYQGLKQPSAGIKSGESTWAEHLDALKVWAVSRPESVTARIALAEALLNYSTKVYSEQNTPRADGQDPWALTSSLQNSAEVTLNEVATMQPKCPHFYFVKLEYKRLQDLTNIAPVFQEAISFEPQYTPYYRLYAIYQRPEWSAPDGAAEKFTDEIANKVGGKSGDALYFEMAAALAASPGTRYFPLPKLSWDRIRSGYSAAEQLYGPSLYNLNQITLLAMRYGKTVEARDLFGKIGDRWNFETWKSQQFFDYEKEYVTPPAELTSLRLKTTANASTPTGSQYQQQVYRDIGMKIRPVVMQCSDPPQNGGPVRGDDLFFLVAADGTIQQIKGWPETRFNTCIQPALLNSKISPPPSGEYWVQIPFAPAEEKFGDRRNIPQF